MQRAPSPILIPNTFRDSNDITPSPTTTTTLRRELVLPSAPISEHMDSKSESRHTIIQPVETDSASSSRNHSANQNRLTNQPLMKSIIRSNESDEERSTREQVFNERLRNDGNSVLEASGYDPSRLTEIDADEAYALQLQEEEYSKDSMALNRHHFFPFQVDSDDELPTTGPPLFYEPDNLQFVDDQQFAVRLQERDNQARAQHQRLRGQFDPIRQRSHPASAHTLEADEHANQTIPPVFARFLQQHVAHNEDDSDGHNPYMNIPHPYFQFLANRGRSLRNDFPTFPSNFRGRGHRRSGNLQETEDDFGPEDYERLLQLDDTIRKKKLTNEQINSIDTEPFRRTSNTSDEENKCGVCLEQFEVDQTLRRFPCRHIYHKDCADRWLQENNACPICREPPVKVPPNGNSRHHRGVHNTRRPPHSNRNTTHRNNTNTTNHHHHQHRRGPPSQRPS